MRVELEAARPRSRPWRAPPRRPGAPASRAASRTTHAASPARPRPRRPPRAGPARRRPPAARRAVEQRLLQAHARHRRRQGRDLDHRRAEHGPAGRPTPRRPRRGRAPRAAPRSRRARAAAAARRRARARSAGSSSAAGVHRARRRRPARAARDRSSSSGPRLHARAVGQVGARQVVGQQRGIEVLQRAQPDDREAGRRRARSPGRDRRRARAPWAGPRPTAVGSSRLRSGVARVAQARRPARGTTRAPRRAARGRGGRTGAPGARPRGAASAARGRRRPGRARSRARRSCPGERCRPPAPLATTVTSAPALGEPDAGHQAGEAGADHDRRGSYRPRGGTPTGRCSTSSVPWKIQSSRHGLAHLVAVEDRLEAHPAVLQEHQQQLVGALGVGVAEPVEDPGGAVGAEAALAGAHPQPQRRGGRRRGSSPAAAAPPPRSCGAGISSHSQTSWSSAMSASRAAQAGRRARRCSPSSDPGSTSSAVRHGRGSPSCSHIASTTTSAISRKVVSLPPVIVRKPAQAVALQVVDQRQAAAHVAGVVARSPRARP